MTRAAPASVFQPFEQERALELQSQQVVFCGRCQKDGLRTALVHKLDAIGRTVTRCPICDRVAPPTRLNPNEVLRPQSLISEAQLLPACPPGVLRCQSCARPVDGDARLCERCELPGLGKGKEKQKRSYKPRPCEYLGCGVIFQPTGPRSRFCGEHVVPA